MSHKFRIAYFVHSLRSDWNNGNAHFLRGLLSHLQQLGHHVAVFEPEDEWSLHHLREEQAGARSLEQFAEMYPQLQVHAYNPTNVESSTALGMLLENAEIVIVHEWNAPELAKRLLDLRETLGFKMLFHDTHHRASSSPEQICRFGVDRFDGVLAFGEALRSIYRNDFGIERVWTLHEAADTDVFQPKASARKSFEVVWVGNWGDEERSAEIKQFLLQPASQMREQRFCVYGVRYPADGLAALHDAGVGYGGYLPNLEAPAVYGSACVTIHIPRQQYAAVMTGIPTIRVFEALACGIPLISAPWQDTEGLFREGDYLTAHSGDEMRRSLECLLGDRDSAMAQAQRGRETVLARHTCRHRAEQLSTIFEELTA